MFSLIPWSWMGRKMQSGAVTPFEMVQREMESLVNRAFGDEPVLPEAEPERFWGVSSEETDKEMVLRFELPGFEPGELSVNMTGNALKVEANRPAPEGKKDAEAIRVRRVITLPGNLDFAKIEAVYRNGMLEVHVPWAPRAQGRTIEVKT